MKFNASLGFFLLNVSACVSKAICEEEVLSKGHLITTLLIVFHEYLLVGDKPNPPVFSESLETGLLITAYRPKNDISKT